MYHVLLDDVVKPDEVLVQANNGELGLLEAGQPGTGVHRELHFILL